MPDNKFGFGKVLQNIERTKRELPIQLANQAQNYFTGSFTKQGWDSVHWKEVKRREPGTPEYKYPKKKGLSRRTSPILVRTGTLRRAVSNSIRSATFQSVRLIVDLPYAKRHNDGLKDMPQRKFMGDSPVLRSMQRIKIGSFFNAVWHT